MHVKIHKSLALMCVEDRDHKKFNVWLGLTNTWVSDGKYVKRNNF